MKKLFVAAVVVAVAVIAAGRCEFADTVISGISESTYKALKYELGDEAGDADIAEAYLADKGYWEKKALEYEVRFGEDW